VAQVRTLGNIIWFIFGGLWLAIGYAIAGIICFILIITIPFGIQAFKLAGFALWPFGRAVVQKERVMSGWAILGNVIWIIVAGIWMAIAHILTGIVQCLTIIGIPLGLANFKLVPLALAPFGREVVSADDPLAVGGVGVRSYGATDDR
jgi:uncharacterized membrane protein YccF (DUF307 family)